MKNQENKIAVISNELKETPYRFKLEELGIKSLSTRELTEFKDEKINIIYIAEKSLEENPHIINDITGSIFPFPKIVIDSGENIRRHISDISEKKQIDRIPTYLNIVFTDFLHSWCFSEKLKGSLYLKYAFYFLSMDENALLNIKKNIYMEIGKHFSTGDDSVERNIAFAIKKAYVKAKESNSPTAFLGMDKLPTNSEFIKEVFSQLIKII